MRLFRLFEAPISDIGAYDYTSGDEDETSFTDKKGTECD